MTTRRFYLIFTLLITALQACHNTDQKWDSKSSADTLNNMKDVAAPGTSAADTPAMVMSVSKTDAKFAVSAANGGLAEVVLGRLALQKGQSKAIKDFGAMMIRDHGTANLELIELAKNKGISLPKTISNDEQEIETKLVGGQQKNFDKAYASAMIADHKEDIKDFESAITQLRDDQLKAFAVKTLPVLKMHLAAILKINTSLK